MIYFITQESNKYVKIGYTTGMAQSRLHSMQTGNPHKLCLLAVIEGTKEDERALHQRFKAHLVRGEWFWMCWDIQSYIDDKLSENMTYQDVKKFIEINNLWGDPPSNNNSECIK